MDEGRIGSGARRGRPSRAGGGAAADPWELYDELIAGIPDGPRVRRAEVMSAWVCVTSDDGGLGLSSQYGGRSRPPLHDGALTGMPLRDAAGLIRSWNLVEAALGAAAINAWYNRADRVDAVGRDVTAPGADPTAFAAHAGEIRGRRVAVVGHFPGVETALGGARELSILERAPQEGDFPDTAAEYVLPEQDIVFITGAALANKSLPRLLALCRGARTLVVGPSTPLTPVMFAHGADCLSGLVPGAPHEVVPALRMGGKGRPRAGRMVNLVPHGAPRSCP